MPNYTWNVIDSTALDEMKEKYASDESAFDFNKLIPMPESLNMTSGSSNDEDIYYYLSDRCRKSVRVIKKDPLSKLINNMFDDNWIRTVSQRVKEKIAQGDLSIDEDAYERGRTLIDNYKKYGAITWYEWCWSNWGTKWNAFDVDCSDCIFFTTAWAAPEPIFQKMCEDFPNAEIHFESEYEEGFIDYYENRDGRLTFTKHEEIPWDDDE